MKASALGCEGHTRFHVCCMYTRLWACKYVRADMSVGEHVYVCVPCTCMPTHEWVCVCAGMHMYLYVMWGMPVSLVAVGRCAAGTSGRK